MDINNIPVGYGLLFHGHTAISRAIQRITKSHWNHCAVSLGNGYMREACFRGVKRSKIIDSYSQEILVFSVKEASKDEHVQAALWAATTTGGYGFFQLGLIFLVWKYGLKHWWLRELLILWNMFHKKYICSELVADCWIKSGRSIIPTGINLAEVMPKHFFPEINPLLKEEARFFDKWR